MRVSLTVIKSAVVIFVLAVVMSFHCKYNLLAVVTSSLAVVTDRIIPNSPYRITEAYQHGTYKLQTMEDVEVPRTWHAVNLKKCFM